MSCITRYKEYGNNLTINSSLKNLIVLSDSNGRMWRYDARKALKLNTGKDIAKLKVVSPTTRLNAMGDYAVVRLQTTIDGETYSARTTNIDSTLVLEASSFADPSFLWSLLPSQSGTGFYLVNQNGLYVGYDEKKDALLGVVQSDHRKLTWTMSAADQSKNKLQALSLMIQGYNDIGESGYVPVDACVFPKETRSYLGYGSACSSLGTTNKDMYPSNGCSISTQDRVGFQTSVDVATKAMNLRKQELLAGKLDTIKQLQSVIEHLKATANKQEGVNAGLIQRINGISSACHNDTIQQVKNLTVEKTILQSKYTDLWNKYEDKWAEWTDLKKKYSLINNVCRKPMSSPSVFKNLGKPSCLEVPGASHDYGKQLQMYQCHGGVNQQWVYDDRNRLVSNNIDNPYDPKCMDVSEWSHSPQHAVHQWGCHEGWNQKWLQDDKGRLHPQHAPEMCLDVGLDGKSTVINYCNDSSTQKWQGFWKEEIITLGNINKVQYPRVPTW